MRTAWTSLGSRSGITVRAGESADPPAGFTLKDYADTLAGFLTAVGIERPHVGGLSFGSVYALLLYRFHPQVVRSLILVSAYAGWAGSLPDAEIARRKQWLSDVLERPVEPVGPDFLATVYPHAAPAELLAEAMEFCATSQMHKLIRTSRLVVNPEAGHGVNAEAPAVFNAAVREFLAAQRSLRRAVRR